MLEILIQAVAVILGLSVVVFIHELGHFQVARWFGVAIESFSIGFGKEITGWTDSKGTRWKISWLPLGGYVKFLGDENAASMPSAEKLEQLRQDPETYANSFHFKPLYQRALVVAAGPIANFILAIVIFGGLAMIAGLPKTPPRVDYVVEGSPAAEAGIRSGDIIVSINGGSMDRFEKIREAEFLNAGRDLPIVVERDGERFTVNAAPERKAITDAMGNKGEIGSLGIYPRAGMAVIGQVVEGSPAEAAGLETYDWVLDVDGAPILTPRDFINAVSASPGEPLAVLIDRNGSRRTLTVTPRAEEVTNPETKEVVVVGRIGAGFTYREGDRVWSRLGPFSAVLHGAERTWSIITMTLSYIGGIFAGTQSTDQLGGPIRIVQFLGFAASISLAAVVQTVGLLSVSIGLINLFPVPLLDGGHLMFYAYEAVTGRPLNERAQEIGFGIGLMLVLALMIFATWNDLSNLFGGG